MSGRGKRMFDVLRDLESGRLGAAEAMARIEDLLVSGLGSSSALEPDLGREARIGFSEVIYAEGKTEAQVVEAASRILETADRLLVTRVAPDQSRALVELDRRFIPNEVARTVSYQRTPIEPVGRVNVFAAGTTDVPIAEEAAVTAEILGARTERYFDVGVAGLHRLLMHLQDTRTGNANVVVAGLEGALPSVVAGLTEVQVIAVPTSVGYGASFDGLAALLAMLNSCAPGVVVVNIDNGFGAGFAAGRWNASIEAARGRAGPNESE